MPTKKQLHFVWETQFESFGGSGQPKQHHEGSAADNGLAAQKTTDIPMVKRGPFKRADRKKIGEVSWRDNNLHLLPVKK
ncbi:hypothetical protein ASE74_23520 [Pedobacter sp. Leaf216]|uniref:hypothetical protein n=1 Tax=Pedobacter sp. Leaf216 TaxID=1735684 RepID=UPI0006FDDFFB|nr:hypothetical protein [Pedobacter sp. Leaf216]KQM70353.1 hypothetical protein ASE74_23520 [Pedobacter sp. Leaf216]